MHSPSKHLLSQLNVLTVLVGMLLLMGCEKEVKVNVNAGAPQLVVNGFIEKGLPPVVVLTHSIGFFSKIDLKTLENSFVHDAQITVSNGMRAVKLREYDIDTGGISRFYFYTIDSADLSAFSFRGETDQFYKLSIVSAGTTYESLTKVPNCQPVDSMVALVPASPPERAPTGLLLNIYYSDPDTLGNCVRYFTQRNSDPMYPGYNSVYDDQIVSGTKHTLIPLSAGFERNGTISDSAGYVFPGDTVLLKWCAIDRNVYNFYITYEYSLSTVGNPFSTPINVRSNISNGALGIWAGYGTTYKTLIIPK